MQTDRRPIDSHPSLRKETPSEMIKRVVGNNSEEFQPIRTLESDKRLAILKQAVLKSLDLQTSYQTVDSSLIVSNIREISISANSKISSQDIDTSSEISQTSLTEKKRDIETQMTWVQSQLHHL